MNLSGETLAWTAAGIMLALFVSEKAEDWFGVNISTILENMLGVFV